LPQAKNQFRQTMPSAFAEVENTLRDLRKLSQIRETLDIQTTALRNDARLARNLGPQPPISFPPLKYT
jgi:outer membrane protein TolC